MIKLYKVNHNNKYKHTNIEFIQDIIIKKGNLKIFNGPISCMTQSNKNGDILISCWDGNVYSFEQPNIDSYSKYDDNKRELYKELFCSNKKGMREKTLNNKK